MTKRRAAILYYGQPRIIGETNFALSSVKDYCKRHGEGWQFETYMHMWSLDTERGETYDISPWARAIVKIEEHDIRGSYNPTKLIFERQKKFEPREVLHEESLRIPIDITHVPNMLSQLYSVTEVCKLVDRPEDYEFFVVLRTDSILDSWNLPLLNSLDPQVAYYVQDFLNIFGVNTVKLQRGLFPALKTFPLVGEEFICAETLRNLLIKKETIKQQYLGPVCSIQRYHGNPAAMIENFAATCRNTYWTTTMGVAVRAADLETYICRFPDKKVPAPNQWVGTIIPSGVKQISYRLRFWKLSPLVGPLSARSTKPERDYNITPDGMPVIGQWYPISINPDTLEESLFLFIILDRRIDVGEVIVEIDKIRIRTS